MACSVHLSIVSAHDGTVMVHRWLGGSAVVERLREVVRAVPDSAPARGDESWAIRPAQLSAIESSFFSGAPSEGEIGHWASLYGDPDFWWFVDHNF